MSNFARLLSCLLLFSFFNAIKGQSFYKPEINWIHDVRNPYHVKILKVIGDSAIIFHNREVWLKDLRSGETLKQIAFPGSDSRFNSNKIIFWDLFESDSSKKNIEIVTVSDIDNKLRFIKYILNDNLEIIETGQELLVVVEKKLNYGRVRIIKRDEYYEILYFNSCSMSDGKLDDHYFNLITAHKDMKLIDNFLFIGTAKSYVHSVFPESNFSKDIAYQLLIDFKDQNLSKHMVLFVEKNGKILKLNGNSAFGHVNFIRTQEENGIFYGYCFRLKKLEPKKYVLRMDKFEINNVAKSIDITDTALLVKTFSFVNVSGLCTKSIIENNHVKLLFYPMDRRIGGSLGSSMGHATYYDFSKDKLNCTYCLPFHFEQGLNGFGASMDMSFQSNGNDVILAYNDFPENVDPKNEKEFEKIPPMNSDKIRKYGPVFYKFTISGVVNRNPLRDQKDGDFYNGVLSSNGYCLDKQGKVYFPFWNKESGKLSIVKITKD